MGSEGGVWPWDQARVGAGTGWRGPVNTRENGRTESGQMSPRKLRRQEEPSPGALGEHSPDTLISDSGPGRGERMFLLGEARLRSSEQQPQDMDPSLALLLGL